MPVPLETLALCVTQPGPAALLILRPPAGQIMAEPAGEHHQRVERRRRREAQPIPAARAHISILHMTEAVATRGGHVLLPAFADHAEDTPRRVPAVLHRQGAAAQAPQDWAPAHPPPVPGAAHRNALTEGLRPFDTVGAHTIMALFQYPFQYPFNTRAAGRRSRRCGKTWSCWRRSSRR